MSWDQHCPTKLRLVRVKCENPDHNADDTGYTAVGSSVERLEGFREGLNAAGAQLRDKASVNLAADLLREQIRQEMKTALDTVKQELQKKETLLLKGVAQWEADRKKAGGSRAYASKRKLIEWEQRMDSLGEELNANPLSKDQLESIATGLLPLWEASPLRDKRIGDVSPEGKTYEWIVKAYQEKSSTILDELLENLVAPAGVSESQKLQILSLATSQLWKTSREHYKGSTRVELLVMRLYTMAGPDIDRLMTFEGIPESYESDKAGWEAYEAEHSKKRNGAIFSSVNWAIRTAPFDEEQFAVLRRWANFIMVIARVASKPFRSGKKSTENELELARGLANLPPDVVAFHGELEKGAVFRWGAPSSCAFDPSVSRDYISGDAANAVKGDENKKRGRGVLFTIRKVQQGLPLQKISKYEKESELLLPPMSEFRTDSVLDDNPYYLTVTCSFQGGLVDHNSEVLQVVKADCIEDSERLKILANVGPIKRCLKELLSKLNMVVQHDELEQLAGLDLGNAETLVIDFTGASNVTIERQYVPFVLKFKYVKVDGVGGDIAEGFLAASEDDEEGEKDENSIADSIIRHVSVSIVAPVCIGDGFLRGRHEVQSVVFTGDGCVTGVGSSFMSNCSSLHAVSLAPFYEVGCISNGFLSRCSALESVDLVPFSKVTVVGKSFMSFCGALRTVDLTPFYNVADIGEHFMFRCTSLESATSVCFDNLTIVRGSFLAGCSSLLSIEPISFSKVTAIEDSFMEGCSSVGRIDLSSFTTVTSIGKSFLAGSNSLQDIDLTPLSGVTSIGDCFLDNCSSLRSIDLSPLSFLTAVGEFFLASCSSLQTISLTPLCNITTIESGFLSKCSSLQVIDLTPLAKVTVIGDCFLGDCTSLEVVTFPQAKQAVGDYLPLSKVGAGFLEGCEKLPTLEVLDITTSKHVVHHPLLLEFNWSLKDARVIMESCVQAPFWFQHRKGWRDVSVEEEHSLCLHDVAAPERRWLPTKDVFLDDEHLACMYENGQAERVNGNSKSKTRPRHQSYTGPAVVIRTGEVDTISGGTGRDGLFVHALQDSVPTPEEVASHDSEARDYIGLTAVSLGARLRSDTFLLSLPGPTTEEVREVIRHDRVEVVKGFQERGVLKNPVEVSCVQGSPQCLDFLSGKRLVLWADPSARECVPNLLRRSGFTAQVCLDHCELAHLDTKNIEKAVLEVAMNRDAAHLQVLFSDTRVLMAVAHSKEPVLAAAATYLPHGHDRLIRKMLKYHFYAGPSPSRIDTLQYNGAGVVEGTLEGRKKMILKHGAQAGVVLNRGNPNLFSETERSVKVYTSRQREGTVVSPLMKEWEVELRTPNDEECWVKVFEWLERGEWIALASVCKRMLKTAMWVGNTRSPFLAAVRRDGLGAAWLCTYHLRSPAKAVELMRAVRKGPLSIVAGPAAGDQWQTAERVSEVDWSPATAAVYHYGLVEKCTKILEGREEEIEPRHLGHYIASMARFQTSLLSQSIAHDHLPLFRLCFPAEESIGYDDLPHKYGTHLENILFYVTLRKAKTIFLHLVQDKEIPREHRGLYVRYVSWLGLPEAERLFPEMSLSLVEKEEDFGKDFMEGVIKAAIRHPTDRGAGLKKHRQVLEKHGRKAFLEACKWGRELALVAEKYIDDDDTRVEGVQAAIAMGHIAIGVGMMEGSPDEEKYLQEVVPSATTPDVPKADDEDSNFVAADLPTGCKLLVECRKFSPWEFPYARSLSLWSTLPFKTRMRIMRHHFSQGKTELFSKNFHGMHLLEILEKPEKAAGRYSFVPRWHTLTVSQEQLCEYGQPADEEATKPKPVLLTTREMRCEGGGTAEVVLECQVWSSSGEGYRPTRFAQVVLSVETAERLASSSDPKSVLENLLEGEDSLFGVYVFLSHDAARDATDVAWILHTYSKFEMRFSEPLKKSDLRCFTVYASAEEKKVEDRDDMCGFESEDSFASYKSEKEEADDITHCSFMLLRLQPPFSAVGTSKFFIEGSP
eukprot:TRINITY_DN2757_c0_g1_i3.p1 TRINITY_DN2757_c0_g1~~TRINITY_DN2757_c0_g1_i3.p1  ORF type:complete len:1984 (+),score=458.45 TRINITY_DN2757_c0_g1_i3:36-5987(+)